MSVPALALLAALAWLGADIAIVGGWVATVGIVRRRNDRRMLLQLGLSLSSSATRLALRRQSALRVLGGAPTNDSAPRSHSAPRRRRRAS